MQFSVPKSIDIEDKIVGPFTIKQAVFIVGAGAITYISFEILPTFFAILIGIPVAALGIGLAFVKINGQPLIVIIQAFMGYMKKDRFYLWKHQPKTIKEAKKEESKESDSVSDDTEKLGQKKLHDLAWALDVLDQNNN